MNSQTTQTSTTNAADEGAIRAITQRMIDAWNKGSGEAFAAPFTSDDFDSLPTEAQRQMTDLVASLKQRHQPQAG